MLDSIKGNRTRFLAGLILIIAAVFVLRLFYIQIIQHGYYVDRAQVEQVKRERLPANRGEIYAMNGSKPVELVKNETVYTVFVDPAIITDTSEVAKVMKEIAGGNVRDGFEKLLGSDSRYQVIANRVTRVQAEKIKKHNLKGIGFTAISQRVYPEGQLASQALGFVNNEGIGVYGLEGFMNTELSGQDGRLETVTDVSDVPLTVGDRNIREAAVDGKNVVMTIDRNIQSKVEDALIAGKERTGATELSAVVMNPNTGQVMAMANYPTYDPGQYYRVQDVKLFNNNVISMPYEPGSVIKTFTLAAAIDKGVARPTDTFYNTDKIRVGDRVIGNASKGQTGVISFQHALNWSLNTGFVTLAQRMGDGKEVNRTARDTMYDYFHNRLQLGNKTGIELSNESAGIVISPDNPDGNAVRYSNMSFGQGLDATMIQVSSGFSAIINGGSFYKPTIVGGYIDEDGKYIKNAAPKPVNSNLLSSDTSAELRKMTHVARTSSFPTIDKPGYYVGGKTGTSQVVKNGKYTEDETIATYLGYGGGDLNSPEYVIMVSVHGEHKLMEGARDAMPVFTDISNWMLDYLKIQPKG